MSIPARLPPIPGPGPTIDAALRDASARLSAVSDTPWLDAQRLFEHVLGLSAARLIACGRDPLPGEAGERFAALIARRRRGEPLAYVTGRVGFWTLDLAIAPPVLVPRPDTETLVATALDILPADRAHRVADLGTGCGAIALALASERPNWPVLATDRDDTALSLARSNRDSLALHNIDIRAGDWLEPLGGQRLDAIVSNPPYIAANDAHLSDPALAHESAQALVAGDDGLAAIRQIAAGASQHLHSGGWLILEHGATQAAAVHDILAERQFSKIETRQDLAGNERVTLGAVAVSRDAAPAAILAQDKAS